MCTMCVLVSLYFFMFVFGRNQQAPHSCVMFIVMFFMCTVFMLVSLVHVFWATGLEVPLLRLLAAHQP